MNKRIGVGIALVVVIVVATVLYMSLRSLQFLQYGSFTITLEPTRTTMEVGESRNFTITVVSTGYEGNVSFQMPMHPRMLALVSITSEILTEYEESGGYFLQANGNLTLILRVTSTLWGIPLPGYKPTLDKPLHFTLTISAFGNFKKPYRDLFLVFAKNSISITITPPSQ